MEKLGFNFKKSSIGSPVEEKFEITHNFTRLASYSCELMFAGDMVYVFPAEYATALDKAAFEPIRFGVNEIAACRRKMIAGFIITLNDGTELSFSNVFGKKREGIMAAIQKHKS